MRGWTGGFGLFGAPDPASEANVVGTRFPASGSIRATLANPESATAREELHHG